jgi:hypothetical protein
LSKASFSHFTFPQSWHAATIICVSILGITQTRLQSARITVEVMEFGFIPSYNIVSNVETTFSYSAYIPPSERFPQCTLQYIFCARFPHCLVFMCSSEVYNCMFFHMLTQ